MYAFAPSNLELLGLCAKAWLSVPAQKLLDDRERAALAQRDAGEEREEQVAGEEAKKRDLEERAEVSVGARQQEQKLAELNRKVATAWGWVPQRNIEQVRHPKVQDN